MLAAFRRPAHEALKAEPDLEARYDALPEWAVMARWCAWPLLGQHRAQVHTEAPGAVARTALALRLHKARHGAYPETLDALAPGILTAVPNDPCTGRPLVYRRVGEGFIVYSLGLNLTDDGGTETWDDATGDVVWKAKR